MGKLLLTLVSAAVLAFGQYTAADAGAPPDGLPAAFKQALNPKGTKIADSKGTVLCDIWFRAGAPPAAAAPENNATITTAAHGSLLAVVQVPTKFYDRRGQPINAGLYTARLSFFPENGDHQGVAPQRDFLLLSPIAIDADPNATPNYDTLVKMSTKASGTPHPAVLSCWKPESDYKPGFDKLGEHDWVLQTEAAGMHFAVILIGKAEG